MNNELQDDIDMMAVEMYRAEHPGVSINEAIVKLMEMSVIKLPGEALSEAELTALRKKFSPRPKSADPNVDKIYSFMEQNDCDYETALIKLSETGVIKY